MKKLFLAICLCVLSSSLFAAVFVRTEAQTMAIMTNIDTSSDYDDYFSDDDVSIFPFMGLTACLEIPLADNRTWYLGATAGADNDGYELYGLVCGWESMLLDTRLYSFKLQAEISAISDEYIERMILRPALNILMINSENVGWFVYSGISGWIEVDDSYSDDAVKTGYALNFGVGYRL